MLSSLIAQSDLPSEFLFVALVESQLRVESSSSRGAAGLWQFMESTGKLHGLQVNQYVDERRDHVKSTRAAIAYLSTLKKKFGVIHHFPSMQIIWQKKQRMFLFL
jgi:membrane-bound lytic murein transglycosylase D